MKKMKTLFEREFENHNVVKCLNKMQDGCEWVLREDTYATEKIDGTCCLIKDNKIYKRFDLKPGRKLPNNAIPCQDKADEITSHFPHWVLCDENNPADKYHIKAFNNQKPLIDGTYELIGPHFQGNPYNLTEDILEKHGLRILRNVPRDYEGLKKYLEENFIEGIVFYGINGEMCKIKRSDFGFEWNKR